MNPLLSLGLIGVFGALGLITFPFFQALLQGMGVGKEVSERVRWKYLLLFLLGGVYLGLEFLEIPSSALEFSRTWLSLALLALGLYLLLKVFDEALYSYLVSLASQTSTKIDDALLPLLRPLIRAVGWSVILGLGLSKLGFDVSALVAGLGVGGLAIAMASQEILKNFLGGVVVVADGTFSPGDRISVKGYEGVVVDFTMRATRVRLDDGSEVIIPNSVLLREPVKVKR